MRTPQRARQRLLSPSSVLVLGLIACQGTPPRKDLEHQTPTAATAPASRFDWLPARPLTVTYRRVDERERQRLTKRMADKKLLGWPAWVAPCLSPLLGRMSETLRIDERKIDDDPVTAVATDVTIAELLALPCMQSNDPAFSMKALGADRMAVTSLGRRYEVRRIGQYLIGSADKGRLDRYVVIPGRVPAIATLIAPVVDHPGWIVSNDDLTQSFFSAPMRSEATTIAWEGDRAFWNGWIEMSSDKSATEYATFLTVLGPGSTATTSGPRISIHVDITAMVEYMFAFP